MIFEISPEPSLRLDARMNGNSDFDSLLTQKGVTVLADFQVTAEDKKEVSLNSGETTWFLMRRGKNIFFKNSIFPGFL